MSVANSILPQDIAVSDLSQLQHASHYLLRGDFAELFEGGFEVVGDFLGDDVGIEKVVRLFEALLPKPEDVEAGFVEVDRILCSKRSSGILILAMRFKLCRKEVWLCEALLTHEP